MDWKWVVGTVVLAGVAALAHLITRYNKLEEKVNKLVRESNEPFPSNDTEEMRAIADAKALCKRMGETFTFHQAYRAVKTVREARKRKEKQAEGKTDDGDSKRTA